MWEPPGHAARSGRGLSSGRGEQGGTRTRASSGRQVTRLNGGEEPRARENAALLGTVTLSALPLRWAGSPHDRRLRLLSLPG